MLTDKELAELAALEQRVNHEYMILVARSDFRALIDEVKASRLVIAGFTEVGKEALAENHSLRGQLEIAKDALRCVSDMPHEEVCNGRILGKSVTKWCDCHQNEAREALAKLEKERK